MELKPLKSQSESAQLLIALCDYIEQPMSLWNGNGDLHPLQDPTINSYCRFLLYLCYIYVMEDPLNVASTIYVASLKTFAGQLCERLLGNPNII